MIKTVTGSGPHLIVQGGFPSTNYFNTGSGYMSVGDMRFNPNTQNIEVYDGQVWRELQQGHVQVGLSPSANAALDWAYNKMTEEKQLEELAKEYPILEDAMRDLEVIKALVKGKKNNDIQQNQAA
jgi:hypothetical protein